MRLGSRLRLARGGERGFALIGVVLFAFVVFLVAGSFFAMASYETGAALYRQRSDEAFALADGAIERARGEFLADIAWRGPLSGEPAGSGAYDLTVTDSTWTDGRDAVFLQARGHVQGADRGVDVWAELKNPLELTIMIVDRNLDANGNWCLEGDVHVNGDADVTNLKCDGTLTNFCCIEPFKMYTEPDKYAGSTYYYVVGMNTAPKATAVVLDADGNTVTLPNPNEKFENVVSYDSGTNTFAYDFENKFVPPDSTKKVHPIDYYFDYDYGMFRPDTAAGDSAVVVNFAESPVLNATSDLHFQQTSDGQKVPATIINSRFVGGSEDQRTDTNFWEGGWVTMKVKVTFTPHNGVAIVTHNLDASNAQVTVGTDQDPGLLYVTRDVDDVQGQFTVYGAIVVLRDWISQGGPDIVFDADFIERLPDFFKTLLKARGQAGIMAVLDWREVALGP